MKFLSKPVTSRGATLHLANCVGELASECSAAVAMAMGGLARALFIDDGTRDAGALIFVLNVIEVLPKQSARKTSKANIKLS